MSTPFQFSTRAPLAPVPLPRGVNGQPPRTLAARPFNLGMQKLAVAANTGDDEAARELLRRCLPGITEEELDDLEPIEGLEIVAHCSRRLQEMVAYLGNAAGAPAAQAAPAPSSPSSPTMNSSTPSPASPAPIPVPGAGMMSPTPTSIASSSI